MVVGISLQIRTVHCRTSNESRVIGLSTGDNLHIRRFPVSLYPDMYNKIKEYAIQNPKKNILLYCTLCMNLCSKIQLLCATFFSTMKRNLLFIFYFITHLRGLLSHDALREVVGCQNVKYFKMTHI